MNRRIIKALNTLDAAGCDQIMNVSDHTQRVFDSDLNKLTQMVAEMGGLAQKQVTDAIDALARHDVGLARRVIALDGTVDGMLRQIEEKAVATIALDRKSVVEGKSVDL